MLRLVCLLLVLTVAFSQGQLRKSPQLAHILIDTFSSNADDERDDGWWDDGWISRNGDDGWRLSGNDDGGIPFLRRLRWLWLWKEII